MYPNNTDQSLTILHSFMHDPNALSDSDRLAGVYDFGDRHIPLLVNVLQLPVHILVNFCRECHHGGYPAPTREQFIASARPHFRNGRCGVPEFLDLYEERSATLAPVDADGAMKALENIVASLTNSTTNPDGPIRRYGNGTFLDGAEGPRPSGTPTERAVWLALYYETEAQSSNQFMWIRRLLTLVGGSYEALQSAIRSLIRRGIVERIHESGGGPMVRLHGVYSYKSADARVAYQQRLAKGTKYRCYESPFSSFSTLPNENILDHCTFNDVDVARFKALFDDL